MPIPFALCTKLIEHNMPRDFMIRIRIPNHRHRPPLAVFHRVRAVAVIRRGSYVPQLADDGASIRLYLLPHSDEGAPSEVAG
jgi:hypothetical protein